MKISRAWLEQYVDIPLSPEELSDKLTMAGLEVESVETIPAIPEGVVTAKILSRRKHENSDHLSICEVDRGGEVLQIVCGAPNCDAGNVVPLATIGTVFPDGDKTFTIKKGKIRGVESCGMMCSAHELGLDGGHDGLMILPPETPVGIPLGKALESDTVYDCSVTPNRPDWLSHIGVARDLAALLGTELKETAYFPVWSDDGATGDPLLVSVKDPERCPLYAARVIRGVKTGESPDWMKKVLNAAGIHPINNLVDITNYVMMECGVPLHAFDLRNLKDGRIVVRCAAEGETIVALDGKKYELGKNDLCICDTEKPIAVAGIMGGEFSGIQPDTTDVVLESAFFDPDSIRMTSRRLGLASDASYRYERGVDRAAVLAAGHRAASLILKLAGGKYTAFGEAAAPAPDPRVIHADFDRIRALLGMNVPDDRIFDILTRLGFQSSGDGAFTVPSWRMFDVAGEADLAEEVARIYGLDKIPTVPVRSIQADPSPDAYTAQEILRGQLTACGLDEILSSSMMDEPSALADGMFEAEDLIRVNNPISLELAVMRPELLPGMLDAIRRNVARKSCDLALFEAGRVFCRNQEKYPEERDELCVALTGRIHPERYSSERAELFDFYDLKGILESLLEARRVARFSFRAAEDKRFLAGQCAELLIDGKPAGVLGEIQGFLTDGMRLSTPVFAAVIQLPRLLEAGLRPPFYETLSPFPPVTRDVAFLASRDLEHRAVLDFIRKAHVPDLEKVELFDIFEDPSLGEGKKSMAYSLVFRSSERTLTDKEVNDAHEKLRRKLAIGLEVELR